MTRFQSNKGTTNRPAEEIFLKVSDLNNFKNLLPDDRVEKFQSTTTSCSFTIKGTPNLGMKLTEAREFDFIKFVDDGTAPFKFYMSFFLEKISDNKTQTQVIFEADVNSMLGMMLQNPLTNLLNNINQKLGTI